jgi:hypothetical protein
LPGADAQAARVIYPCVSYTLAMDALPKLRAALPQSNARRAQDEVQQLGALTDTTLGLLKALRAGEQSDAAIRQIVSEIDALEEPLLRQAAQSRISNVLDAMTYAKTRACVESTVILFTGMEPFMQRLHEAQAGGDEAATKARRSVFMHLASDSADCYFQSVAFFKRTFSSFTSPRYRASASPYDARFPAGRSACGTHSHAAIPVAAV